jgi:hypothetical protein
MWDFGAWIALGGFAVGGIVWGIRLEGRVNSHQQLFAERKEQGDDRHAAMKEQNDNRYEAFQLTLKRIEDKLDSIVYGTFRKP